ncbi:MAG TPA: hypothetical protein DCM05_04665 [Elusimicrobia bacterium]|nr:hypothetical protein [Elusimicrobiota bacterium]
MTLQAALLLLLWAPAGAQTAQEALDSDHGELSRLMDEATPKVQALEALAKRYFDQKDVRSLAVEHDRLHAELWPLYKTMEEVHTRLKSGLELHEARVLSEASAGLLRAKPGARPLDFGAKILQVNSLKQTSDQIQAFRERATRALHEDDLAYTAALLEQEKSERAARRARRLGLALLVMLLPAGLLLVRVKRRLLPARLPAPALPALEAQGLRAERPLGQDTLGDLFEGTETARARRVLLRRLRPELAGEDLEQLLAEARLASALKHPAILETYAVFKEGGRAFLSVEPREGVSLSERLRTGPLPLAEARKLLLQAASALDHARSRGLLHKDLRPALVWLPPAGGAKVADFSISRTARLAVAKRVRGEDLGSEPYQAPELELGLFLPESDIFSLGAVFYEMLTGRAPFGGPDAAARKKEGVFPFATAAVSGLPDAVDALFLQALAADPKKRPRSAGELAALAERLPV